MPTVLRSRGYAVFFFSHEGNEPAHMHVRKGDGIAKCWLGPVRLAYSEGFKEQELRAILKLLAEHEAELIRAWHEIE